MDSRLIFEASKRYFGKIQWIRKIDSDSEWHLLEVKQLDKIISDFFIADGLHVAVGRKDSFTVDKQIVFDKVKDLFGKVDFLIWNENFKKAIQINKIGVYRTGYASS